MKTIETHARAFFKVIIFSIGSVRKTKSYFFFHSQSDHVINEAYVSFMSGHACLVFQAATFLALYFQARLNIVTNSSIGN